jgi:uncharacterized OB-fold protein
MTGSNVLTTEGIPVDRAFVCDDCGCRWYYTRSRCPDCGGDGISTYRLDAGELLAVTDIAVTPPDVRSPNRVGLARFGDVQLIAQLRDDASVGDRVVFAGEFRLREGDEPTKPRLQSAD